MTLTKSTVNSWLVFRKLVRLAYFEPNTAVFATLKKTVPGPTHDPNWNLQGVLYYSQFSAHRAYEDCANAYITKDLPKLTQLKEGLRNALASRLYMLLAETELQRAAGAGFPFSFMFESPDFADVEESAQKAIKQYPANRDAHTMGIRVLQLQLAEQGLNKRTAAALEKRLLRAKEQLVKSFPDDIETTLWLIDHYFDEDQLEAADKLVRQLGGQRLEDPRAKSLPWKLKLREAMRLSRRKTSLDAAHSALDMAESLWPAWLQRDWLPFLRAAIELRAGDRDKFMHLNAAARSECGATELVGDVMTFAALQQMNLPSADLKPFREVAEKQVLSAKKVPLTELCIGLILLGPFSHRPAT